MILKPHVNITSAFGGSFGGSMSKKVLIIERCNECRHCIDLGGQVYECGKLHIAVNWKEIHPDCPLPDYTEKEDE